MSRQLAIIVLFALAAAAVSPAAPGGASSPPAVELFYIPQEDLSRAPGYSDAGVFLPLAELLRLAREAQRPAETEARPGAVFCPSFELNGTLRDALALEGRLAFRAPAEGWSATLIDDGRLPWISQSPTTGTAVFLVRLNGRTYLFAKGPTSGTLRLKALAPLAFVSSRATLSLGRFFAPCRIELELGESVQLTSATVAAGSTEPASGLLPLASLSRVAVWPTQEKEAVLQLRKQPALGAPSSLRATLARTVEAVGGGLEVGDELVLEDRFAPGRRLELSLPRGMSLLRAEGQGPVRVEAASGTLSLVTREETGRLTIKAVFAAQLRENGATLGEWGLPALAQKAALALRASEREAPILKARPAALIPAGGSRTERRYECWGALPPLEVALVRVTPPQPPTISATLAVARDEATAQYQVRFADKTLGEIRFTAPAGWSLTNFEARRGEAATPCTLQPLAPGRWRADWDPAAPPGQVRFALHRVGAWGAPGTTSTLAVPMVRLDGPRPTAYELAASWPEELEARATDLAGLAVVPLEAAGLARAASAGPVRLAFRATGETPRGSLIIRGRDSDVQATVVSALAIGEDRAGVRALIAYKVKLAPASAFRFTLPRGTGRAVKIEGEGIRESTLLESDTGDEWTVVTQQGVLGDYQLTLEWPLAARPLAEAVAAPEIRVRSVTSQQGFVILEGSDTLALTAETKNLAEADLLELPPLPWKRESRILASYRYIQPPYLLRVTARKFQPEPALQALARESELITTLGPDGERLTQAAYAVAPTSDNQFLEVLLPPGAQVWSVLVNGEGVSPARIPGSRGELPLLVPLPAASRRAVDSFVTVLYRELGPPLTASSRLDFAGPALTVPVNRTTWNLFLPQDFEYLTFRDQTGRIVAVREPAAHFFRTAYYPSRIVFMDSSLRTIFWFTLIGAGLFLLVRNPKKLLRLLGTPLGGRPAGAEPAAAQAAPPEAPPETAPAPPAAEPLRRAPGCAGRIGFLLFVGLVIIVLASISVPNFLEAQVRSKVSRARTDLRSLATAVEAYFVDNNIYAENLERLYQGPVKYITSPPTDPFAASYRGISGQGYMHYVRIWEPSFISWYAYSIGPDLKDNGGEIIYDPTNGTVSVGDIVRVKDGGASFPPRYAQLRKQEAGGAAQTEYRAHAAVPPPPVTRTPSPAPRPPAAGRPAPTMPAPPQKSIAVPLGTQPSVMPGRPGTAAGAGPQAPGVRGLGAPQAGMAPVISAIPDLVVTEAEGQPAPGQVPGQLPAREIAGRPGPPPPAFAPPPAVRREGLLSLKIEPLQAGAQRRFETLGGDPHMGIRLLEWKQYRRLSFLVWIAVFLALVAVWLIHRRAYQVAFVAGVGTTLLVPALVPTAWVPFFNAAFQGVLLSLLAPLLGLVWKHFNRHLTAGAASAVLLAVAAGFPGGARAESPDESSRTPAAQSAVRILVPYETGATSGLAAWASPSRTNPLAFLGKEDFARLWNAAQRERPAGAQPGPILADVRLDGALVPEKSVVAGTLRFTAANPTSVPARIPLSLAGATLEDWSAGARGASLEAGPGGLALNLEPHWMGTVSARFVLPCETQGVSGRLALAFPETASGLWRIKIPYAGATPTGPRECVVERTEGATVLTAPARAGVLRLSWTVARAGAEVSTATAPVSPAAWQADFNTRVQWSDLSSARWSAQLSLRSATPGRPLPSEVRLALDPGVRVYAASGASLLGAAVSARTDGATTGTELVLRLAGAPLALVTLEGVVLAPRQAESGAWIVPGIRVPPGLESRTVLNLDLADAIEVLSVEPRGLERRSAREAVRGFSTQTYETARRDWVVRLELRRRRAAFNADVTELFAPGDGFLRQAANVALAPRDGSVLHECLLELPRGVRVSALEGSGVSGWVQSGEAVYVAFAPPAAGPALLKLAASSELPTTASTLSLSPLRVRGAGETRRSAVVLVSPDVELAELDLAKASPRPPSNGDQELARLAAAGETGGAVLRAYVLDSDAPLRFGLRPLEATSLETVFNHVTLAEGVQSLDCVVRADPRRGRLRRVEALLLLPVPDPGAASRLEVGGPGLREFRAEPLSERTLRVVAELNAPQAGPVNIRLRLDQPALLDEKTPLRVLLALPVNKGGARAFLQLRRAFEGELAPSALAGARAIDPASVPWPNASFQPMPADQTFELAVAAPAAPEFAITRHARSEALRAVVELMRQRTILTADGFERNELEIVLQNQSEQFLKIALPYPRAALALYETQVASRVVKAAFALEDGREVLLVPLLRTGLLDPELTVRVAYTVKDRPPLEGRGIREQRLPEILGGVPVAQSALVLMLPDNFRYSNFKGSLHQVELVDLEVDEALRTAKKAERISELAVKGSKKFAQSAQESLFKLNREVASQMTVVKQLSEAQRRETMRQVVDRDEKNRQDQLAVQREQVLKLAEEAAKKTVLNVGQLDQLVGTPAPPPQPPQGAEPAAPAPLLMPPLSFPRVGDVFVFRQLQGTGNVAFRFASRESAGRRDDVLFGVALTLAAGLVTFNSRRLFANGRRVALAVLVIGLVAVGFRVALDVAIPAVAVALCYLLLKWKAARANRVADT